ncbi:MAG: ribosome maturation factor RimP [Thermodesulfobacteriota bacterium]
MERKELIQALWEILEPVVTSEGVELVELEFQREAQGWVLRLFIDREGGVTVRDCAEISQQVSHLLDVKDPIDRPYLLEVSSPGLERPIRKLEDFKRFVGQKVKIALSSGGKRRKVVQGILVGVEGDRVLVDRGSEALRVPLDGIAKARLIYPWGD